MGNNEAYGVFRIQTDKSIIVRLQSASSLSPFHVHITSVIVILDSIANCFDKTVSSS